MKNMTSRLKYKMESYWDNINWKLLDKIKKQKRKTVWDLK